MSARCDLDWEDCVDPLPLPVGSEAQISTSSFEDLAAVAAIEVT